MNEGKEKIRKNSEEKMVLADCHSCLGIFISVVRIIMGASLSTST
jgi:hypothetical protein